VTVNGNSIKIDCTSYVMLQGTSNYSLDNYSLTVMNAKLLKGNSLDVSNNGGTVELTR